MAKENEGSLFGCRELKIKEEKIGYIDDCAKIALCKSEESVKKEYHKMYEKKSTNLNTTDTILSIFRRKSE